MILNFKRFVNEKFIPQPTDTMTSASDKNWFNEEEKLIQRFNTYKNEILNIYKSYQDRAELMNRLFTKGFIKEKSKNPKKLRFNNKYLGMWAKICDNTRKISDLEKIIHGNEIDIQNAQQTIADNKGNQTIQDYTGNKIQKSTERLSKNSEKIEELQQEILDLDKQLKKEFELLKKKNKEAKKRIQHEESQKKSASAQTDEGEGQKQTL